MKNIDNSLYPVVNPDYKFQMMKRQWLANGQSGLYNDDIKWLFVEVERLSKETEKLSNEISMDLEFFNEQQQRIKELQAKLDDANETLNQRYIDENETVWTIPTPEAYAIVCKRMHGLKTSNELLRIRLRDYKAWIQKHRTDRKLKWIDVAITMPKDDVELVVLLMDNGRIDIGYKSSKGDWVSHGFTIVNAVTHWMPLPEMPQIDGGKENDSK